MAAKQRFPVKMSDVNKHVSFEDMLESPENPTLIKEEKEPEGEPYLEVVPPPEIKILDTERDSKMISVAEDFFGKDMIPRAHLDDYIKEAAQKLINEAILNQKNEPSLSREVVAPKKLENADDLPEFQNWVEKDRIYVLCTGFSSLSHGIKDRHKKNSPLMYKGRSLRYSSSQASFFMDKQVGDVLLNYISIENGTLVVLKDNTNLQKFLAIHPDNGVVFKEFDPQQQSKAAFEIQDLKVTAHILAKSLDTATLVAVAMLMCKNYSESQDMYTIKTNLYNEIEADPKTFIRLANDRSLKLKSIGRIAVFRGLLKFADYRFYDEDNNVICESKRNENEYEALAAYFATSEGRNLYEYLSSKIES
jgi:hypothetical protein